MIKTGYAYTEVMKKELVEKLNLQNFTQGSAILKNRYHNPKNLIVQDFPSKERVYEIEVKIMRNGYIIDFLTSVDIQENIRIG